MTLLGKVFTGLVFLLAVIFFALSVAVNAQHINQKVLATTLKTQVDQLQNENKQLKGLLEEKKTELAIEQAARRNALAALQSQLDAKQDELEKQETTLANLQSAHTSTVQTLEATQVDLKKQTSDNEDLRKKFVNAKLDRDQIFQRLVTAKDQYNRLQGQMQSLQKQQKLLAADYASAKEKLDILGIGPDTLLTAPATNGKVLAVATNGMVEVSLGRDDGMQAGFTLEAHRNGQYLGRLRIRTVRSDKSTAEILRDYQKGAILEGDRVDTQLGGFPVALER